MKSFAIIGLGRFGSALAIELWELGHEVLAIDESEELIHNISEQVTHAVCGDAREPAVLRAVGIKNFDCAVVAVGGDVGKSALTTMNLKEQGVKTVIAKAQSHTHKKVLERIGADMVVFPEHETGVKLAQSLTSSNILNFIELSDEFAIVELNVPKPWLGKTLIELNIRAKYDVNVIGIHKESEKNLEIAPGGEYIFLEGDVVVCLGRNERIYKLYEL